MSQNENSNELGSMISQLLSDPQKVQQLQQMASSLGLGAAQPSDAACPSNPSSAPQNSTNLSSLIGALGLHQPAASQPPIPDPNLLISLQSVMQRFSQTNPGVELLRVYLMSVVDNLLIRRAVDRPVQRNRLFYVA